MRGGAKTFRRTKAAGSRLGVLVTIFLEGFSRQDAHFAGWRQAVLFSAQTYSTILSGCSFSAGVFLPRFRSILFFVFLALLGGVFWFFLNANRNYQRPAPASAVWSAPENGVRVVSFNVRRGEGGNGAVLRELSKANADFVFLQEVEKSDLTVLSEGFSTVPPIYHASENIGGRGAKRGNAILSRYPLYDVGSIGAGDSFGVWATAVVGERKFKIACVHTGEGEKAAREMGELFRGWRDAASPPMIAGGDFDPAAARQGIGEAIGSWRDAVGNLQVSTSSTRLNLILVSPGWSIVDRARKDAMSEQRPVWVTVGK